MGGVRRIIRIAPPGSKRDKITRSVWRPRSGGVPFWRFPDAFALDAESCFWQSIDLPGIERKMASRPISHALGKSKPDVEPGSKRNARSLVWNLLTHWEAVKSE